MAKYYNKTSGSLAVTLRSGRSLILTGKSWTEVPADEEGSEDIIRSVKRGFIVRSSVENRKAPTAKSAPKPSSPSAKEVKPVEMQEPKPVERFSERTLSGGKTSETRRKKG